MLVILDLTPVYIMCHDSFEGGPHLLRMKSNERRSEKALQNERKEGKRRKAGGQAKREIYPTLYCALGTNLSFGFIQKIHSSFKFMEWSKGEGAS